jgi:hypothetical protein
MDNNKRKLIIIGAVVAVIGIFAAIVVLGSGGKKTTPNGLPQGAKVTIDKDTGNEIVTVPGKDSEPNLTNGPIVLGGDELINKTTITYTQYDSVVKIVEQYAADKIGKITTVKFVTDTIKEAPANDPGDYDVQVKTVGPENILNISINLLGLDRVRVYITNTTQPKLGTFDSGVTPAYDDSPTDEGLN